MNGLEFARYLTAGGLGLVLVHAAPAQMSVEVIDDDPRLVAAGDADRHGDYAPMTVLVIDHGRVERREIRPRRLGPARRKAPPVTCAHS
jgi:hypothetical protein